MKKLIIGCFLLLAITIAQSFAADLGGYAIKNYDSEILINSDGSLDVVETIDVNFSEPRHGIYRTIPTSNQGWPRTIENFQAQGDTYVDQSDSSFYKIRIGDANITLNGPKTYTIKYRVKNGIRYINESSQSRQELYRNIVGNDRDTTIDQVKFKITLFSGLNYPAETFIYYGNYGDKLIGGASISQVSPEQFIGGLTTKLAPRQALTIGIKLPSDYIKITPEYEAIWNGRTGIVSDVYSNQSNTDYMFLSTFKLFRYLLIGVTLAIMIGKLSKLMKGSSFNKRIIIRDKKSLIYLLYGNFTKDGHRTSNKPVTIEYSPPLGYELPQVAMFYHYEDHPAVISALIYYRAAKGWVAINEVETGFWVFKSYEYHVIETSNDPKGATDFDKQILQRFFGAFNQVNDKLNLSGKYSYLVLKRIFHSFRNFTKTQNWAIEQPSWFGNSAKLTPEGEVLYEKLRGYMTYLDKVERPVLEQFIKDDPHYIDKILPWAALFGLDTKLCEKIKDLLKQPTRYNGVRPFSYTTFRSMSRTFVSASTPPPSRSSSGSGFGGGGGSSGGGGGGGGGGSW